MCFKSFKVPKTFLQKVKYVANLQVQTAEHAKALEEFRRIRMIIGNVAQVSLLVTDITRTVL